MEEAKVYMQNKTNQVYKVRTQTIFFFDLDGTLINTDFANFLSYNSPLNFRSLQSFYPRPNRNCGRKET